MKKTAMIMLAVLSYMSTNLYAANGDFSANNGIFSGNVTTSGNITAGSVTSTGNVTAGSINSNSSVTAGTVTSTGNVSAGSINSTGSITANGQIVNNAGGIKFPDGSVQTTAKTLMWDYTVTGTATGSVTSPTLDGNTDGGYEFEFIIYNPTAGNITPRLYYSNVKVPTDYWVARIGSSWSNDSRIYDNIGPNSTHITRGVITITPSGLVSTILSFTSVPNVDAGTWIHNKTTAVANLTQLDVVSNVASSIGINSRFRIWKRNP
ncbi:MAG TPA: hypothetical protein VI298_01480 [Geobacteraceae bacterium]